MRSLLALLPLSGSLVQALLTPTLDSNQRYTVSFGDEVPNRHSSHHHEADPHLTSFLAVLDSKFTQGTPEDIGKGIATAFVQHLHAQAAFRITSAYLSEHSNLLHVHFVQTVNDLDISNAVINVNVDLSTKTILSYGDSAWTGRSVCSGDKDAKQVVFQESACYISYDAPSSASLVDPRIALASFLRVGNPSLSANTLTDAFFLEQVELTRPVHSIQQDHSVSFHLENVPGAVESVPTRLTFLQDGKGEIQLTWRFEYQSVNNWYAAHVEATNEDADNFQDVLFVTDWQKDFSGMQERGQVSSGDYHRQEPLPKPSPPSKPITPKSAIYRVFGWATNDPSESGRQTFVDPADKVASPYGWHSVPNLRHSSSQGQSSEDWHLHSGWSRQIKTLGFNFTDTRGNNVFAQANPSGNNDFELNYRPSALDLNFTFPLGWNCSEQHQGCKGRLIEPTSYINASITELFYTINMIHDLSMRYGFDEAAGNFQERNFGGKGLGNDAVVAMAQDGSGMNNANFATPPDGQRPRMRMYVWDGALPYRDGDLEAGIVLHEFTHGISTRLTGGPANSDCLMWGESGGMGEGWGDVIATLVRMHNKKVRDWELGNWAAGRGIRRYPYSTNMTTNPQTYKSVDSMWEVHSIGAVWAEILFVVVEKLIGAHGYHHDLFPPAPLHEDSTSVDFAAHHEFYNTSKITGRKYPAKGNTLGLQLVLDGMKLQPCRPNFLSARDAIIAADQALTGGQNYCMLMEGFASRGLGPKASVRGQTPFGGGFRTNDFTLPARCNRT